MIRFWTILALSWVNGHSIWFKSPWILQACCRDSWRVQEILRNRLPHLHEISHPNSSPRLGTKQISSEAPFEQIRWTSFTVNVFSASVFYFLSPIRSFVFANVKNKVRGQRRAPSSYLAPFRRHPCDSAWPWATDLCVFWFSIWVTALWLKYLLCME